MPNYPVFTSYAQLDRDTKKRLDKFVDDFREQLRSATGAPSAQSLAFFDRDDVQAGDPWTHLILDAVNQADVLVCFMSPTYLRRPWCGRELEVFLQRYQGSTPAAQNARFIFPVWWQPPPVPRPLPSRLAKYHNRDKEFPKEYETLGVNGLARLGRWKQCRQIGDRIAKLIAQTLAAPHRLTSGPQVANPEAIRNAFDEQQPFDIKLLTLVSGGDSWRPTSAELTLAETADSVAQRLGFFIRKLETGASLLTNLQQAQTEQQVILLVTDVTAPLDPALAGINNLMLPNLALLLVDVTWTASAVSPAAPVPAVGALPVLGPGATQSRSEAWLASFGPGAFADAKATGRVRVAGPGETDREFERIADEVRRRLQSNAPAAKAEDPALAENARHQGISAEVQPILTGPVANMRPNP